VSAKILLGTMVAASVAAVAWGARDRPTAEGADVVAHPPERPWLAKEAAAQIVGPDGTLGPLFADLMLGGLAPSAEARARIAAFAHQNGVSIDLEVDDDQLVAIRFDVSYSGCCGYEGAEVLALRARRPSIGGGCMGTDERWLNDWSLQHDDGTHLRARVDLNRVQFRWERTLTSDEVLARADELVGRNTIALARTARERLRTLGTQRFVLEVPYAFDRHMETVESNALGMIVTSDLDRVTEVAFTLRDDGYRTLPDILKARWGRPTVRGSTWTWRKADRVIEASVENEYANVTVRRRV
jgi:hypothetical protein